MRGLGTLLSTLFAVLVTACNPNDMLTSVATADAQGGTTSNGFGGAAGSNNGAATGSTQAVIEPPAKIGGSASGSGGSSGSGTVLTGGGVITPPSKGYTGGEIGSGAGGGTSAGQGSSSASASGTGAASSSSGGPTTTSSGTTGSNSGCTGSACCTPSTSQNIYAHSNNTLYRVDPVSWTVSAVGGFGVSEWITDLAVSPSTDVMYIISTTALYTVNAATAQATLVSTFAGQTNLNALTVLADGTLLTADASGNVSVIDPKTGALSAVGSFGGGFTGGGDLVATPSGIIYAVSATDVGGEIASSGDILVTVNRYTGAATRVGPIGLNSVFGLAFYGGSILAFDAAGDIARIDPATGAGTVVAGTSNFFVGAGQSPLVTAGCP